MGATIAMIIPSIANGGAERVATDLGDYFCRNGYNVIFFVKEIDKSVDYKWDGIIVRTSMNYMDESNLPLLEQYSILINDVAEMKKLKQNYSVDYAISFMPAANLLNLMSKGKEKIILTLHSVMSLRIKGANGIDTHRFVFENLYPLADLIVFPSEYCRKDWLETYHVEDSNLEVIYNPLHMDEKNHNIKFDTHNVIFVARLHAIKQPWCVLRAFTEVLKSVSDAQLFMLGDGELKNVLIRLAEQLGIKEHVHFMGFVKDVERYYAKSRVMVITSRSEAFSCSLVEAMSNGTPAIVNDCPGGMREILDIQAEEQSNGQLIYGKSGILIPRLNEVKYGEKEPLTYEEKLLAKAIVEVLIDDQLHFQLKLNGKKNSKRFDIENIGRQWNDKLRNLSSGIEHNKKGKIELNFNTFFQIIKEEEGILERPIVVKTGKYENYFKVLENWMLLKECGKSTAEYFLRNNYKNIAIYGIAQMANHLVADLRTSNVQIVFGIDRKADERYAEFPIYSMNDDWPIVDVIVVTPVFDFDSIQERLMRKVDCPVVNLAEVVKPGN